MKSDQRVIEKILIIVITAVMLVFHQYTLDVFQGVNFIQDIVSEITANNNVDNFLSFYIFLLGLIVCLIVLLYPLKSWYVRYGLNGKLYFDKDKKIRFGKKI